MLQAIGSANAIPLHLRGRREKLFDGRWTPLDRNAKVRIMTRARALMRRTEPGRHYGAVKAKHLAVLRVLLWDFHNCQSGRCFPSYEAIAEKADCARSTVALAIKALEDAGILSWVNRLVRVALARDLFGRTTVIKLLRTSNAYSFTDAKTSKSDNPTGTRVQVSSLSVARPKTALDAVLDQWGRAVGEARKRLPERGGGSRSDVAFAPVPSK